jgi:hypothetical protein
LVARPAINSSTLQPAGRGGSVTTFQVFSVEVPGNEFAGTRTPPRIEPRSGDAIPITQETQKLALFGLSGSDDQSTASEQ